ncbi:MAG: hypothetical protein KC620_00515 [Myxococcales bacterium]|nr:hypothetical protein [Myxococcales bacterium]
MIVCPACGNESPEASKHCVHCGHGLVAASPPAKSPGPKTSHFGDGEVKALLARMSHDGKAASAEADNLLAGLPRPRVSSQISPLQGGHSATTKASDRRDRSSSRSTVLGMPLFVPTVGTKRGPSTSAVETPLSAPPLGAAPAAGRASIQSLDAFDDGFSPPASNPAAPLPAEAQPFEAPAGAHPLSAPVLAAAPAEPEAVSSPAAPVAEGEDIDLSAPIGVEAPRIRSAAPQPAPVEARSDPSPIGPVIIERARPTSPAPPPASGNTMTWVLGAVVVLAAVAALYFFVLR